MKSRAKRVGLLVVFGVLFVVRARLGSVGATAEACTITWDGRAERALVRDASTNGPGGGDDVYNWRAPTAAVPPTQPTTFAFPPALSPAPSR